MFSQFYLPSQIMNSVLSTISIKGATIRSNGLNSKNKSLTL